MGADQLTDWSASAISVLDWWRDAGVDVLVADAPRDWLARTPAPTPHAVAEAPAEAALPTTIAAFVDWRTGPGAPEGAGGLLAEGDPAAKIMVVTDYPDGDTLIGGTAGRLFDRMLAAIGLDRAAIYLTTVSTIRPLGGRIAPEAMPRLSELLRHHIALAAPERVLLLGQAPSRALTGTDTAPSPRNLRAINLESGTIFAVASLHPRFLLEKPAMKAQAWKDLRALIGEAGPVGDLS